MELTDIIKAVSLWLNELESNSEGKLKVRNVKHTENVFIADIDSETSLGQLIVEPEGFHPHRHVAMTILHKDNDHSVPFYYYDKDGNDISDIISGLNGCIEEML